MNRIFYPWWMWEHYWAGFFGKGNQYKAHSVAEHIYKNFHLEEGRFEKVIPIVFKNWPIACEHNLTNKSINRVAWLGQACVCYATGVPSRYKYSYNQLPEGIKKRQDNIARIWIKKWEAGCGLK